MSEHTHRFDLPTHHRSIIKVIGVGGGGSNAVNNMFKRGIEDVSFVVCNTDKQALKGSPIQHKLQIGINLTGGLGAGANPEVGKNAAIESKEEIEEMLSDGTKMLFVTAGMGGGTGTGAAPVIASIARKLDVLTVGIVTQPFSFEGRKKLLQAQEGIKELKQHCDTVLVILNDRLRAVLGNLSIGNAFEQADNVLTTAAKSIAETITVPGYVNVDFEDVKTVMKKAGAAVMGSAEAEGEGRALRAAELALSSPLLDYKDIHGAKKILLSIVSGRQAELHMDELMTITDYIQDQVGTDAEMIFGHSSEDGLREAIRVTVIATGFEREVDPTAAVYPQGSVKPVASTQQAHLFSATGQSTAAKGLSSTCKVEATAKPHLGSIGKSYVSDVVRPEELSFPFSEFDQKRQYFQQRAEERVSQLATQKGSVLSEEMLREYLAVPAYVRRGVQLVPLAAFEEKKIVRYQVHEEEMGQFLG
ncbi:MAG: cell division protein FtsZ [Bacteroidota bacterium]